MSLCLGGGRRPFLFLSALLKSRAQARRYILLECLQGSSVFARFVFLGEDHPSPPPPFLGDVFFR